MRVVSVNLYHFDELLPEGQAKARGFLRGHLLPDLAGNQDRGTFQTWLDELEARVDVAIARNVYWFQVDGTLFHNADVPAEWEG